MESPSTDAQDYGKKCHTYLESYLKGEIQEFPNDYHGRTCMAAKSELPAPNSGEVEMYFEMKLPKLIVPIVGYMDYCSYKNRKDKIILLDHKIVKSDLYLLTPEKLAETNQIITYSKFLFDCSEAPVVEASYLYVKRGGGWAKKVTVELSRNEVETAFEKVASGFEDLQVNYSRTRDQEDLVPQILSACEKWGGCPFKDVCWGNRKGTDMSSSLLDKLKSVPTRTSTLPTIESNTQATTAIEGLVQVSEPVAVAPAQEPVAVAPSSVFQKLAETGTKKAQEPDEDEDSDESDDDTEDAENLEEKPVNYFALAAESEMKTVNVLISTEANPELNWDAAVSINAPEYTAIANAVKEAAIDEESREAAMLHVSDFEDDSPIVAETVLEEIKTEFLSTVVEEDENIDDSKKTEIVESENVLDKILFTLDSISVATRNALVKSGLDTLGEILTEYPDVDSWPLHIKSLSAESIAEIKAIIPANKAQEVAPVVIEEAVPVVSQEAITIVDESTQAVSQEESVKPKKATKPRAKKSETVKPEQTILPGLEETAPAQEPVAVVAPAQEPVAVVAPAPAPAQEPVAVVAPAPAPAQEPVAVATAPAQEPVAVATAPAQESKKEASQPLEFHNVLLLGTMPVKGLGFVYLEDLIEAFENDIAAGNSVPHISLVNFSKGYDQLAAMVKVAISNKTFDWSKPIYASAQAQITYSKAVSVLLQHAGVVLKNC